MRFFHKRSSWAAVAVATAVAAAALAALFPVRAANAQIGTPPAVIINKSSAAGDQKEKSKPAAKKSKKDGLLPLKTAEDLAGEADKIESGASPAADMEAEAAATVAEPAAEPQLLPATAATPTPPPKPKPAPPPAPKPAAKEAEKQPAAKPPSDAPKTKLLKDAPAQVDFEEKEEERKPAAGDELKPPERMKSLPAASPGRIEYFDIDLPPEPVLDLTVVPLDGDGAPGLAVLTTGALDVYEFESAARLRRVWHGAFKEKRPQRGLAGTLSLGSFGGKPLLFISMNPFKKAFAYEWKDGKMQKAGRTSGIVVKAEQSPALNIVSEYGRGITSFSGAATKIVDTSGGEPRTVNFPLPVDYYTGCVLRWSDVSASLAQIAVVTEDGAVQVYQDSHKKSATDPEYGDSVVCVPKTAGGNWLVATSRSAEQDAVVTLEFTGGALEEVWRTPPLGGAVVKLAPCDLDRDGVGETLGVIAKRSGGKVLFRLLPVYKHPPEEAETEGKSTAPSDKDNQEKREKTKPKSETGKDGDEKGKDHTAKPKPIGDGKKDQP